MQVDQGRMSEIVGQLNTKSAKIRALSEAGFARADIARFLDIRYQHVRNVLTQQPPRREPDPSSDVSGQTREAFDDTTEFLVSNMRGNLEPAPDGTLHVPSEYLKSAGIEPGDRVLARVIDGEIRLSGYAASLKRAQWIARRFHKPGASEVDDFIAERRSLGARGE